MKFVTYLKSGALAVSLTFFFASAHSQSNDALAVREIEAHRKKQFQEFKDPKESPLSPSERRKLKRLIYFPIDLKYRVTASFIKTETAELFRMKTTTARLPEYRKYGEVHFRIDSQHFRLEVYQNPEVTARPGYEDYLFIPFTDLTNGEESYDVGRYLDFRIPDSEEVRIDFNQSYNPYCSYSDRFSCPIPPAANNLPVAIYAGEKKFKDH
jgi:uncharacterized protein